jgi:hypothetical protein
VLLDHLPEFFDRHPIRVMKVHPLRPGHLSQIVNCPQLLRLKELHLGGQLAPEEPEMLAGSPYLSKIESLHMSLQGFGGAGLAAFATSSSFPSLCELYLGDEMSTAGITALSRTRCFPQLRSLILWPRGRIEAQAIETLAAGELVGQLTSLSITQNRHGDVAAIALLRSPYLHRLESLNLWNTRFTSAGIEALACASGLRSLTDLGLSEESGPTVPPSAVRALAQSAHLGKLQKLSFQCCQLGDEGAVELAHARWRLQRLNLTQCGIGDVGMRALADSPVLTEMKSLVLVHNRIRDEGALALAESPYLTHLENLELRENRISKEARRAIRSRFGRRNFRFTY